MSSTTYYPPPEEVAFPEHKVKVEDMEPILRCGMPEMKIMRERPWKPKVVTLRGGQQMLVRSLREDEYAQILEAIKPYMFVSKDFYDIEGIADVACAGREGVLRFQSRGVWETEVGAFCRSEHPHEVVDSAVVEIAAALSHAEERVVVWLCLSVDRSADERAVLVVDFDASEAVEGCWHVLMSEL